jgi:phosphoribosyl-ATP pyrophosphohydrolase/phosphoribosyl-AMP cyclohydrolase
MNRENEFLYRLIAIIKDRKSSPTDESYVSSLLDKGIEKISQKLGEESSELIIDAVQENRDGTVHEAADLLFHLLVLLEKSGIEFSEIIDELEKRNSN